MSPLDLQQLFENGLSFHRNGELVKAKEIYQLVLQNDPNNSDALRLLAIIEHECKNFNVAVDLLDKAITINSGNHYSYCDIANSLFELGNLSEALINYDKAIKIQPE